MAFQGFPYKDTKAAVRVGHVSSVSDDYAGFHHGDSGGLPGFSGGGIFDYHTGGLMAIARGSKWKDKLTSTRGDEGDVLQMISVNCKGTEDK